jgi:ubiquinone/menaquinone biosynthesis C-methylase UbiE
MPQATRPHPLRPDRFDRAGRDQLVDIRDLQAAIPGLRRLREWAHAALAVEVGETVVDIGSGTGSEVFTFAEAVGPSGTAIGVEPDERLLASAQHRGETLGSAAKFVPGDAYNLSFGAEHFDAALCERVFQHLTNADRGAREIARVLRPGGRVVLVDADWGTTIVHPGARETVGPVIDTLLNGTTNPHAGRRLAGQLTAAGLVVDDIGSQALIQDRSVGAGPLVAKLADMTVARMTITQAQRDQLIADLDEAAAHGAAHLSVTMFAVLAHKPR